MASSHLATHWKKLALKIGRAKRIVLFLDYDGTLVPICSSPKHARLAAPARKLLQRLSTRKGMTLAIVSGRSLREVQKYVRVPGICYAGNHGLEVAGPGVSFIQPQARAAQPLLRKIRGALRRGLAGKKGVWVEDKGLTLTIHFRQASRSIAEVIESTVRMLVHPYLHQKRVRLTTGKEVVEIRPSVRWNKGSFVRWYLKRLTVRKEGALFPICVGDDVTDEDAFLVVRRRGVAIRVGANLRESKATNLLRSPTEVHTFLRRIDALRS